MDLARISTLGPASTSQMGWDDGGLYQQDENAEVTVGHEIIVAEPVDGDLHEGTDDQPDEDYEDVYLEDGDVGGGDFLTDDVALAWQSETAETDTPPPPASPIDFALPPNLFSTNFSAISIPQSVGSKRSFSESSEDDGNDTDDGSVRRFKRIRSLSGPGENHASDDSHSGTKENYPPAYDELRGLIHLITYFIALICCHFWLYPHVLFTLVAIVICVSSHAIQVQSCLKIGYERTSGSL